MSFWFWGGFIGSFVLGCVAVTGTVSIFYSKEETLAKIALSLWVMFMILGFMSLGDLTFKAISSPDKPNAISTSESGQPTQE